MKQRILIVDDEPNIRLGLKDNLEFEGYEVDEAENGYEGLKKILNNSYSIILLDVMMPELSGFDVCKQVRSNEVKTPIILLTAKGEEIDKVRGLEIGADDYITKPFSLRELFARIKAVIRRSDHKSDHASTETVTIGRLTINFCSFKATDDDGEVKMSHKEFEVINYLLQNKNTVVSRFDLLENVWGYQEAPTTRTVDNFILKIRNKIEENPNKPAIILTVHGAGYKLLSL